MSSICRSNVRPVVLLLALIVAGCDNHDSPTDPSQVQPAISGMTPGALQPGSGPQAITFSGSGFGAGLQLIVTAPSGAVTTVEGPAIQAVQPTVFQATVVLDQTGTYSFMVRNVSGVNSPAFTIVVQPPGSVLPAISSVTPASVPRSTSQATLVALQGVNFAANAAVIVTDGAGMTMVLTGASLTVDNSPTISTIRFSLTFSVRGTYSFVVTNPGGDASNPVFVTVT
jgi:hypothetical protein